MNGINENKIINIFAVTNQILVKVTYFALKKIDKIRKFKYFYKFKKNIKTKLISNRQLS